MNWISVKEKLPMLTIDDGDFKSSEQVIAFFKNGKECWCESVTLKLWYEDDEPNWYYDYDCEIVSKQERITHWQPLVKPE